MTAKEFYRKRLVDGREDGIMKQIAKVMDIDEQVRICEEYSEKVTKERDEARERIKYLIQRFNLPEYIKKLE